LPLPPFWAMSARVFISYFQPLNHYEGLILLFAILVNLKALYWLVCRSHLFNR
jgi:hypothetical protein